jgi:hypothetical protein
MLLKEFDRESRNVVVGSTFANATRGYQKSLLVPDGLCYIFQYERARTRPSSPR